MATNNLVPFRKSKVILTPGETKGWPRKDLQGQKGTKTRAIHLFFKAKVNATAPAVALTEAKKLALLKSIKVDFKHMVSLSKPFHPYQEVDLTRFKVAEARLMESLLAGYTDSTTGLGTALVAGANYLSWVSVIPTGHIEAINENAAFGMGYEQLLDSELMLTAGSDPLKALDSNLALAELEVFAYPDWREAPRRCEVFGHVTALRRVTESDDHFIDFPEGLHVAAEDYDKKLSETLFGAVRVKVGNLLITDFPSTPARVHENYLKQPDTGAVEASIADSRTPLLEVADTDMRDVPVGRLYIEQQEDSAVEFNVEATFLELVGEEAIWKTVEELAKKLPAGNSLRAVSVAAVDGLKLPDTHLPFVGYYAFTAEHPEYYMYPCLEAKKTDEAVKVRVHIPDQYLAAMAQRYGTARMMSPPDQATMDLVVQQVANDIPSAVISTEGYKGGESKVVRQVRERILDTLTYSARQQAAQSA